MIIKIEAEALSQIASLARQADMVDRLATQFKGELDTYELKWLKIYCERFLELPLVQAFSTEGV